MAKKISKHSRAARRNEIEEPEAKELHKVDRAEKTDLASAIIRATVKKNEDLLHNKHIKKQEKNKINKNKQVNATLTKDKLEKALSLSDRLEGKIIKSKLRAKMVQNVRKANWDQVNALTRQVTGYKSNIAEGKEDDDGDDDDDDDDDEFNTMEDDIYENKDQVSQTTQKNAFALLDEVEA